MSLWHCKDCTTAYSVGAERCPHCGSTDYQTLPVQRAYVCTGCETPYRIRLSSCPRCRGTSFEETSMAKITKAGGPSNADLGEQDIVEEPLPAVDEETQVSEDTVTEPADEEPDVEVDGTSEDEQGGEQGELEEQEPDAGQDVAPDYSSLTVAELKAELDKRKVQYPSRAKASELVELLTKSAE
jgi:predicted nucleic-acid-binding Zn-ribbon protein